MNPQPDHGEKSYRGSGGLAGRRALVTGGDSGMGRAAAAIAFAREGADVAVNYLPVEEPDAREVIAVVRQEGRKGIAIPGDIRDEGFCIKLVADAVRRLGGLDILVNNAARQVARSSILEISSEQFDTTFNVYAMFWITKAAIPHLGPGSTIINTASINAYDRRTYWITLRRRAQSPSSPRVWPKSSPSRAFGLMPWRRDLYGRRCSRAGDNYQASYPTTVPTRPWGDRASPWSWPPSTFFSLHTSRATPPDKSMALLVDGAVPRCHTIALFSRPRHGNRGSLSVSARQ